MNRTSTTSHEIESPAASAPAGKAVCPFCGLLNDQAGEACRRCGMENTPLTRQATRARIGPWYVMQSRNPAAPGMRFNTLQALIRKGQITGRSVVRGPTTHQLWRYASQVRGVSRELGLCYACGAEVSQEAATCAKCARSQELPANPDVLVEVELAPRPTEKPVAVMAELTRNPEAARPAGEAVRKSVDEKPRVTVPGRTAASVVPIQPKAKPQSDLVKRVAALPAPAATGKSVEMDDVSGQAAAVPIASGPEPLRQRTPAGRPVEPILSARELAAAFSLRFEAQPEVEEPPAAKKRIAPRVAIVILFVLIGGGIVVWAVPDFHVPAAAWIATLKKKLDAIVETTPESVSPPGTQSKSQASGQANQTSGSGSAVNSDSSHEQPLVSGDSGHGREGNPSVGRGMTAGTNDSTGAGNGNGGSIAASARGGAGAAGTDGTGSLQSATMPAPPNARMDQNSVVTGQRSAAGQNNGAGQNPGAGPSGANRSDIAMPQNASSDIWDQFAMDLRGRGLDAEAHHNYDLAVYFYEQVVERVSKEHWPKDIETLLKTARAESAAAGGRGR